MADAATSRDAYRLPFKPEWVAKTGYDLGRGRAKGVPQPLPHWDDLDDDARACLVATASLAYWLGRDDEEARRILLAAKDGSEAALGEGVSRGNERRDSVG